MTLAVSFLATTNYFRTVVSDFKGELTQVHQTQIQRAKVGDGLVQLACANRDTATHVDRATYISICHREP